MISQPPKKQSGFTLIELSIVIAIGLILILGGITFGSRMILSSNIQVETQNVGVMATNIKNLYQRRYANLTVAQAIALNLVPPDLLNGAAIEGHFGGITVAPAALAGAGANTAAAITLAGIPQDACTQLAPALMGFADEMDVGAAVSVKSRATPNPLRDAVGAACGAAGGPAVSIVLRVS